MKKLVRLLLRLAFWALLFVCGIVLVNTLTFHSRQLMAEPAKQQPLAAGASSRFAALLSFPTLQSADSLPFRQFWAQVDSSWPLVDALLYREPIGGLSRLYRWPGRNPALRPILLTAHIDVVPAEADDWAHPPFSGISADHYLYGRGALDDKLSCAALLEAVETLLRQGYQPQRSVYLAFGHDEESGGYEGAARIAEHLQKKGLHFEYVLDEGSLVVEDALEAVDRPVALIGLAEKGFATYTLSVHLPAAGHSSMPPPQTAVGIVAAAVSRLEAEPFPSRIDGAVAEFFSYVGPEMRLPERALFANRWLFGGLLRQQLSARPAANAMIRTTTAATMIRGGIRENVLPTRAAAKVNARILPGESVESVRARLQEVIADERVSVQLSPEAGGVAEPSPVSPAEGFAYRVIEKTIRQHFPEAVVAPSLVVALTDARHYSAVSDHIYRFLPVQLRQKDLARIHGINERIRPEQYAKAVQFYMGLVKNSCE